jgi:hypothetical protein
MLSYRFGSSRFVKQHNPARSAPVGKNTLRSFQHSVKIAEIEYIVARFDRAA